VKKPRDGSSILPISTMSEALKSLGVTVRTSSGKIKVIKVTKEYFQTEDKKDYFFEPFEKEISVKDM